MIELGLSEEYLQGFNYACQLKEKVKRMNYEGWQCPVCKRVYAPFVTTCMYCKPEETTKVNSNIYETAVENTVDYIKEIDRFMENLNSANAKLNYRNTKDDCTCERTV